MYKAAKPSHTNYSTQSPNLCLIITVICWSINKPVVASVRQCRQIASIVTALHAERFVYAHRKRRRQLFVGLPVSVQRTDGEFDVRTATAQIDAGTCDLFGLETC